MRLLLGAGLVAAVCSSAIGQEMIALERCTPIMAVHFSSCELDRIWSCNTSDGQIMQHLRHKPNEAVYIAQYDEDYKTATEFDEGKKTFVLNTLEIEDPFSLSHLLNSGRERSVLTVGIKMPFYFEPIPTEATTDYELTEQRVTIDAVNFEIANFRGHLDMLTNAIKFQMSGKVFADRESEVMFFADFKTTVGGSVAVERGKPVTVLQPDDPWFYNNTPLHGCERLSRLNRDSTLAEG